MTNEEKAKEIALKKYPPRITYDGEYDLNENDRILFTEGAQKMAEWKDKQFKKYLKKRLKDYKNSIHTEVDAYDYGYMDALKEVIKEIFWNIKLCKLLKK